MTSPDPGARAKEIFVTADTTYGCAETSFVVLKDVFGLPNPHDSSPAMVLNGGVAYDGGMCGAVTGAALAVGQLAGARIADHAVAKRTARHLIREVIDAFAARYGATNCRELTGYDMRVPGEHDRFIEAGEWRTSCADQVAFVVDRLAALESDEEWVIAVERATRDGAGAASEDGEDGEAFHG